MGDTLKHITVDDIMSEVDNYQSDNYYLKKERENAISEAADRKIRSQISFINSLYKKPNDFFEERRKSFTTTKFIFYLLLINCIMLEIYAMVVMYKLNDLSALPILITAVIGESISFAIYCLKAYFAKRSEENMKFEKEKFGLNNSNEEDMENEYVEDFPDMDETNTHVE